MSIFNHFGITNLYFSEEKTKSVHFLTFTTELFLWTPLTQLRCFISNCRLMTFFSNLLSYAFLVLSIFLILFKLNRAFSSYAEGQVLESQPRPLEEVKTGSDGSTVKRSETDECHDSEMTILNGCVVTQYVWHAKKHSMSNDHKCRVQVKMCSPSLVMVKSPHNNLSTHKKVHEVRKPGRRNFFLL